MEQTLPHVIAPSELASVNGKGRTPFTQQTVVLMKQASIELTWQAHYWRGSRERQPYSLRPDRQRREFACRVNSLAFLSFFDILS